MYWSWMNILGSSSDQISCIDHLLTILGGWSTGAPNVTPLRNKGLVYLLCLYSGKPMLNKLFIRPYFWWVGCSQQGLIGQNPQIWFAAGGGAATFDSCMDDGLLGSGKWVVVPPCLRENLLVNIGPRYMCGKDQEFTKPHGFLNSSRFEWPGHESFCCLRVYAGHNWNICVHSKGE